MRSISNIALAIGLAVLAGAADLLGGLLTVARVKAGRRSILYATAVAAGFIVAAAMLDRLPEAISEANPWGPYCILGGFLAIYLVENLFSTHAHVPDELSPEHDHDHEAEHGHALVSQFQPEECLISPAAATAALLGLLLHTLFDGIAIAAGFMTNTHTGTIMFLAVIFHKFPEGFSVSALMLAAGRSARFAVLAAAGLGVATVCGAVLATVVALFETHATPVFLTLATGTFLYIGCSDMIPATNKGHDRRAVVLVIVGAALFILSSQALRAVGIKP